MLTPKRAMEGVGGQGLPDRHVRLSAGVSGQAGRRDRFGTRGRRRSKNSGGYNMLTKMSTKRLFSRLHMYPASKLIR